MHQQKYVNKLLERFEMINCKAVTNPFETNAKLDDYANEEKVEVIFYKQIVGSLRYLYNSRQDIYYAVSILSRFISMPKKLHLVDAKGYQCI